MNQLNLIKFAYKYEYMLDICNVVYDSINKMWLYIFIISFIDVSKEN